MILDINNAFELKRYDDFVKINEHSFLTQDRAWAKIKNNWSEDYVYVENNGEIVAAMSILSIKAIDGKWLLYANRGPVCDIYDKDTVLALVDEVKKLDKFKDAFLLRFDPAIPYDEKLTRLYKDTELKIRTRGADEHSFIQPRRNAIIDISKSEDDILGGFHSKTRYNIRLSYRKGVTTRISQMDEDLNTFFEETKVMAERNGITYRPKEYFKRLIDNYDAKIFLSDFEGTPLSSAILIMYKDYAWYMYGASNNLHRNYMPNYQMQWEMIKYAKEHGATRYDFGGIFKLDDEDGLYRFKRGFLNEEDFTEFIGEFDLVLDEEAYKKYLNK